MVAAHTRITPSKPVEPGEDRQAGIPVSELSGPGHAFRGILFGAVLGAILWGAVVLALL